MARDADLHARIESHDAVVGIIGLGYVGLPLAVAFAEAGFRTIGFDVKPEVVDGVNEGLSHITDITSERLAAVVGEGRPLEAALDFGRLEEVDAVVICVPTPLSKTDDPDLSFVVAAAEAVRSTLRSGQLIVLESTTYPGTTREIVQPMLEETGLVAGRDFFLAFSPERVDPANPVWHIENTPKVVGGLTPTCHGLTVALYRQVIDEVIEVSSPEAAEMAKLLENTFRAVNIGLVNEMAVVADRLGIDIWEVIDAASTKPYGFMRFFPGPGLGGHCIPVDPIFLAWKMRTLHDVRESPAIDIIDMLRHRGAIVEFHDPMVDQLDVDGEISESVPLTVGRLEEADAVVIATDHSEVDYETIGRHARIVVDPRNAMKNPGRSVVYPIAGPPRRAEAVPQPA
ncbi:MAG: nucleotide sugar dehydrogenase [Gemmatimonadota bacterium]